MRPGCILALQGPQSFAALGVHGNGIVSQSALKMGKHMDLSTWPLRLMQGARPWVASGEQEEDGDSDQWERRGPERQRNQPGRRRGGKRASGRRGGAQSSIKERKNAEAGEEKGWSQHQKEGSNAKEVD